MSMIKKIAITLVLSVLVVASAVGAAAQAVTDTVFAREVLRTKTFLNPQPDPVVRTAVPSAYLRASNDGSRVEIQGGKDFGFWSVVGSLSSPVSGEGDTWVADLAGLSSGTNVGVSLTGFRWGKSYDPKELELPAVCQAMLNEGVQGLGDCTTVNFQALSPDARDRFERYTFTRSRPLLYSFSASGGPSQFEYMDTTGATASVDRYGFVAGASLGTVTSLGFVAVSAQYSGSYGDAAPATFCVPIGGGAVSRCRTQPLGAPQRTNRTIARGELKQFLGPHMGINPRVSYRFEDHVYAAELPVYFVLDAKGSMIAGVASGWNSTTHRIALGVFVGKAFGFQL